MGAIGRICLCGQKKEKVRNKATRKGPSMRFNDIDPSKPLYAWFQKDGTSSSPALEESMFISNT